MARKKISPPYHAGGRRKPLHPNRLHLLLKERGIKIEQMADDLGLHRTTLSKLVNGRQKLTQPYMVRFGDYLHVAPAEIIEKPVDTQLRRVPVTGALHAGAWREAFEWEDEADRFEAFIPDDPALRHIELYGGKVEGDSMNLVYPDGSVVILAPFGGELSDDLIGKRFHIRRERADGMVEETLKTLIKGPGGKLFLKPESNAPEHQEWIPLDGQSGMTIQIIGRVRYVVRKED